jgi:O-antigen/teichoic acid export membrane protein
MRATLLRNSVANFGGAALPALVTLITLPIIVAQIGESEYGVLALIVAIVGYFAIIDINVAAGSIKYLAEYHAKGEKVKLDQVVSLGILIYLLIGILGGVSIFLAASWLVVEVFVIPPALHDTAVLALRIGGAGFFFGQLQFYLQSIPQSLGRYDISARFEAIFGTVVPLLTVGVVLMGGGLVGIVLVRLMASMINVAFLKHWFGRLLPEYRWVAPGSETVHKVLNFSGFAYLKNIAAVTYLQADKLIVGAFIGMQALAFYVVPFTLVNRVFGITYRLSAVMFPFSSSLAAKDEIDRLCRIYLVAVRYTIFLNGTIAVLLVVLAHMLLKLWMGESFAAHSSHILALLAVASFLDSLTNLPTLINDGLGHPRVTGLFAILRAVVGIGSAYFLVSMLGILGAAISQLLVSAVMAIPLLVYVHGRTVPVPFVVYFKQGVAPALACTFVPAIIGWYLVEVVEPNIFRTLVVIVFLLGCMSMLGYRYVLRQEDKNTVTSWLMVRLSS